MKKAMIMIVLATALVMGCVWVDADVEQTYQSVGHHFGDEVVDEYIQVYPPVEEFDEADRDAGSPNTTIVHTVKINPDMPDSVRIVRLDMWEIEPLWSEHGYEAVITVMREDGEITQLIDGIVGSYNLSWGWVGIDPENPLNFHLADYNGDGCLDMGLRWHPGGSMRNDPHFFWLWDADIRQFVRNEELETLSAEWTVSPREDGRIGTYARLGNLEHIFGIFEYINGEPVFVEQTHQLWFLNEDGTRYIQITTTDHITGVQTITHESLDYEGS